MSRFSENESTPESFLRGRWKVLADLKGRNQGLDLLRGVAIGLVLVTHTLPLLPDRITQGSPLIHCGFFGVELFFVLSGFLIGGILLRLLEQQPMTPRGILTFWSRRWIRTLPNYFLFLAFAYVVTKYVQHADPPTWRYLFFLQNLSSAPPPAMGESWSLAVEEWFYLTCPIALSLLTLRHRKLRLAQLLGLLAMFTLPRLVFLYTHWNQTIDWDGEIRKVVILRLDAIFWGLLMAWLVREKARFLEHRASELAALGAVLVGVGVYLVSIPYSADLDAVHKLLVGALQFSITSMGFALLIPAAMRIRIPTRPAAVAASAFSKISYSLYLCHFALAQPLAWKLFGKFGAIASVPAFYVLSITISCAIFLFYEHPITSLRDRWRRE